MAGGCAIKSGVGSLTKYMSESRYKKSKPRRFASQPESDLSHIMATNVESPYLRTTDP
jgi:hypothetical protein